MYYIKTLFIVEIMSSPLTAMLLLAQFGVVSEYVMVMCYVDGRAGIDFASPVKTSQKKGPMVRGSTSFRWTMATKCPQDVGYIRASPVDSTVIFFLPLQMEFNKQTTEERSIDWR